MIKININDFFITELTESYVVSNSKICEILQKPLPISSKEGMKKTIQSFKN